jgi:tetratricopeptide (TPR) repeat protein
LGFVSLVIVGIFVFNLNKFEAVWYADVGAVQTGQIELANFPSNEWIGSEILPKLDQAEASLHTAVQLDPVNQTANYYLGLIAMLRADFQPASIYLAKAYEHMPYNRGIIKSLGYCYVWLGDMDQAKRLLIKIPEAGDELNVYVWWWGTHGRDDLSMKATTMISEMNGQ